MDQPTKTKALAHLDAVTNAAEEIKRDSTRKATILRETALARGLVVADPVDASPPPPPPPPPPPDAEPPPPDPSPSIPAYRLQDDFPTAPVKGPWQIQTPFTSLPTLENGMVKIVTPPAQAVGPASFSRRVWFGAEMPAKSEWWFGGDFLIPDASKMPWSRFLALNHYEGDLSKDWRIGLWTLEAGRWAVGIAGASSQTIPLIDSLPIPSGRRVAIDIHARLGQDPLTEVFIDQKKVGESRSDNTIFDTPINLYQGGLPFWYPPNGKQTVYFDRARCS